MCVCLVDYFFVIKMLLGNKSYTVGKPVDFTLNDATIVGWAAKFSPKIKISDDNDAFFSNATD